MKKKKFNYYNLFIYGFKLFTILPFVFVFLYWLKTIDVLVLPDYWDNILWGLVFSSGFLMLVCISFAKKYENKITTYIDKPKKLRFYFVNVKGSSFLKYVEHCLLDFHYDKRIEVSTNHTYYYFEKFCWWGAPDHCYQMNFFVINSFEEFSSEHKKELLLQKQKLSHSYHKKNGYFNFTFLVIVERRNQYLDKYLKLRTTQYYRNYCFIAVYVKEEGKIYFPYSTWAQYRVYCMRKKFEKVLGDVIIRGK